MSGYYSVDYDNGVGMDSEEEDCLEYRDFLWIEKESFEGYMGVKVHEAMTYAQKDIMGIS